MIPVKVPWRIPASTPFLSLTVGEVPEDCPTEVIFLSHCLLEGSNPLNEEKIDLENLLSPEEMMNYANNNPDPRDKIVKATFQNSACARMHPLYHDKNKADCFPYSFYNCSEIQFHFEPSSDSENWGEEEFIKYSKLQKQLWWDTGICPDPRMYEIENSPWLNWLQSRGMYEDSPVREDIPPMSFKQYLLVGHSCYIEVIASGWSWQFLNRDGSIPSQANQ